MKVIFCKQYISGGDLAVNYTKHGVHLLISYD